MQIHYGIQQMPLTSAKLKNHIFVSGTTFRDGRPIMIFATASPQIYPYKVIFGNSTIVFKTLNEARKYVKEHTGKEV